MNKWTTVFVLVLLIGASYGIAKNITVTSEAEAKQKLATKATLSKNYCEINSEPYKNASTEYEIDNNPKIVAYTLYYTEDGETKPMPAYAETKETDYDKILKDVEKDCEQKYTILQQQKTDENNTITIQYNNGITGEKYDLNTKKWN